MKDRNFIKAFSRVTFDDSAKESLIHRFREEGGSSPERGHVPAGGRGGLRPVRVFAFVLAAALAFGGIAYASGAFSGGQFVKSVVAPADTLSEDQSGKQDQFLLDASTDVGKTVTQGNVAITLDEVTADEFAIFTKLTIRSVDGKPLYEGKPDVIDIMSDIDFQDNSGEWPETIPSVELNESVKYGLSTIGQPVERLDDGSDPACIELATRQYITGGSLNQFPKARADFSRLAAYFGKTEADAEILSNDMFSFEFDLNPVAARTFTTEVKGSPVEVKLSPFTITYRYNTRDAVFSESQYKDEMEGASDYLDYYELYLSPVDKDGNIYDLGSGGGFKFDTSEDDGHLSVTFELLSLGTVNQGAMIDVDSIVGVCEGKYSKESDGTVYPLREG
ncbi:MAG: DUF4179 domain-containing protein [Clostridiales Family XIII bacterium]|jgi:hypothetical protein|nr:DUF4179 domain-containing protein [Clostridiales Family XIII bacterium]